MTRRVSKIVWISGLSLSTLATTVLITGLMGRSYVAQGCSNFWINPQTGSQECLDGVSTPSSGVGGALGSSGSQTPNRDVSVVNTQRSAPLPSQQIQSARPHLNPLQPPDTRAVRPSPTLEGAQGAISSQGSSSRAFGPFRVPYTAARVSHLPTSAVAANNAGYLSATYPYRAIGRLTFRIGNGSAHCSASLIRRSVIVTAAHCIQNFGSGNNIFNSWTYTPASYNGSAPYGSYTWLTLVRPVTWANGSDTGSGAARNNDLAVIALRKNSSNQFVGGRTGYLNYGWGNYSFVSHPRTGNLAVAALSTLGYPGLLDAGRIMQRTDGPSYLTTVGGAFQIYQGSTFTGGSSGGPWIANFKYQDPAFSGGAGPGSAAANNVVVGVTSWGAADPNVPKDNFSSQFRQNPQYPNANYGGRGAGNIGALLNTLCSTVVGGSTLAAQGYCN